MTFNRYGIKIENDKNQFISKNKINSTPRSNLSINDQNDVYHPSFMSNKRYTKDDNSYKAHKLLHSYSSKVIPVAPIRSTFLSTNRLSYKHLLNQIAQITNNVYLSGINAVTMYRIEDLGITMLVSLITDSIPVKAPNLKNIVVPIEDCEFSNLRLYLDRVIDKMHREELRGGRILVHCLAGVSRSASLVIAYLMKYYSMTLREAYNHVRLRRPYIQPNIGFWKQLIEFENILFGRTSVRLKPSSDMSTLVPDVAPSALAMVMYNNGPSYT